MTTPQYLEKVNQLYVSGNAREHAYRGDLQQLLTELCDDVLVTNEPARVSCGSPDYMLSRNNIAVGHIEAKDIGEDLNSKKHKEQFDRYKKGLPNLIITDYLTFQFFKDGDKTTEVIIGETIDGKIQAKPESFAAFENLIKDFSNQKTQSIKSSKKLAEMMAGKARLLSDVIEKALDIDIADGEASELKGQYDAFKEILIHDMKPKGFADVYAQTIAYGLFAARLHDPTIDTFSRAEAAELIPKSNPFLRKLFSYIAGPDLDTRIQWIVDDLIEIFHACNVADLLKDYGKATKMEDPIIHFYETFLAEYDAKLRKARGVWYTPQPVVDFIVRSVDEILKTEFDLPQGLADTSKVKIKLDSQTKDKRSATGYKQEEREVHRVQILDPATGTGTFLAEVVKHIHKKFEGQEGIWSNYVEEHLIPRLNGFELLMASYAMAHLKLDLLLTETGFKPTTNQRLRVYLTNSLEESHPDTGTLFANWLSTEANEANHIKRDTPVMCVIGNPPYSGESTNKGPWIMNLMDDYKKEPGGKEKLKERNPKSLNDDYVKFLRYGQHFIEKNGSGVLAYINPHGFIDNPTYRGMRWNLLKTYDKIYTIDLHGNSKKKEVSLDGSVDQNVFDIMQGVSINIFMKTGKKKENDLGDVFHYDLYGKRNRKYNFLTNNSWKSVEYSQLKTQAPMYYMTPKDFKGKVAYENGFQIIDLFPVNTSGIKTHRDAFVIDFEKENLSERIRSFFNAEISNEAILSLYKLKAKPEWMSEKRLGSFQESSIHKYNYRPFDTRWLYYSPDLVDRGRERIFSRSINSNNLGLLSCRQQSTFDFQHAFISRELSDMCSVSLQTKETGYYFPLYLYPEENTQQTIDGDPSTSSGGQAERVPNLNIEIVTKIAEGMGMHFLPEEHEEGNTVEANTFTPTDLLDYIYAVLHSPTYREKYKEFLKIDFPRVPYPKDIRTFTDLVELGTELRQIHLLESSVVEKYITKYPISGDNEVVKPSYVSDSPPERRGGDAAGVDGVVGRVHINKEQYFDGVPELAWNFYIGGYQPLQKWLKDRKGRKLNFEDILHYQKIVVALTETDRIMKEIDKIEIE